MTSPASIDTIAIAAAMAPKEPSDVQIFLRGGSKDITRDEPEATFG
jgi:hypothetical protein